MDSFELISKKKTNLNKGYYNHLVIILLKKEISLKKNTWSLIVFELEIKLDSTIFLWVFVDLILE